MTPCVQSRCSKPTELIPLRPPRTPRGVMPCHKRYFAFACFKDRAAEGSSADCRPRPRLLDFCATVRRNRVSVSAPSCWPAALAAVPRGALQKGGVPAAPSGTATLLRLSSGTPGSHGLTGGVYKARERIHRAMADARLLANPASWSRVADSNPNWDGVSGSAAARTAAPLCAPPL